MTPKRNPRPSGRGGGQIFMSPQLSSCIKPAVSISNAKTKHKTNYQAKHERNNDESGHDPHPPLSKVLVSSSLRPNLLDSRSMYSKTASLVISWIVRSVKAANSFSLRCTSLSTLTTGIPSPSILSYPYTLSEFWMLKLRVFGDT